MAWYAPGTGKKAGMSRTRVKKGAVPLGQHSHSPEAVLGTKPLPVRVGPTPVAYRDNPEPLPGPPVDAPVVYPPTGIYQGLPTPAPGTLGCRCCTRTAALVDPSTGAGFCAEHWLATIAERQMD